MLVHVYIINKFNGIINQTKPSKKFIDNVYTGRYAYCIQYTDDNIGLYIKILINIRVIYEINKSYDWRKEIQLRTDGKF